MRLEYKKTKHYEMWIEEEIMHVIYAKNINVTIEIARALVFDRIKISNGKDWPVMVTLNNVNSIDKESRVYLANEGSQNVNALSILTHNILDVLLVNMFSKFSDFPVPLKIFSNKEKALIWLNQFKEFKYPKKALQLSMGS